MLSSTVLSLGLLAVAMALPASNSGLSQVRNKRQVVYCDLFPNDPECHRRKMHVNCKTNPNSPRCPRIEKDENSSTKTSLGFLGMLDEETLKKLADIINSVLEESAKPKQKEPVGWLSIIIEHLLKDLKKYLPASDSGLSPVRNKRQLIYCNIYPNDPNCTKRKMHINCKVHPFDRHCPNIFESWKENQQETSEDKLWRQYQSGTLYEKMKKKWEERDPVVYVNKSSGEELF